MIELEFLASKACLRPACLWHTYIHTRDIHTTWDIQMYADDIVKKWVSFLILSIFELLVYLFVNLHEWFDNSESTNGDPTIWPVWEAKLASLLCLIWQPRWTKRRGHLHQPQWAEAICLLLHLQSFFAVASWRNFLTRVSIAKNTWNVLLFTFLSPPLSTFFIQSADVPCSSSSYVHISTKQRISSSLSGCDVLSSHSC